MDVNNFAISKCKRLFAKRNKEYFNGNNVAQYIDTIPFIENMQGVDNTQHTGYYLNIL